MYISNTFVSLNGPKLTKISSDKLKPNPRLCMEHDLKSNIIPNTSN